MIPPQEPGTPDNSVKITGCDEFPLIINFPPFNTTRALSPVALLQVMVEPASNVKIVPAAILTIPLKV